MANQQNSGSQWTGTQAYVLAIVCLVVGVAIGYLVRGSASPIQSATAAPTATSGAPEGMNPGMGGAQQQPTPEQMKHMADTTAAPLLEQLKSTPGDAQLLYKIGNVYYDSQQFPEAVKYYGEAAKANPNALDVRTDLATAYYYAGDTETSLKEFDSLLKLDPKYANALFNQGMIRWQGKMDIQGAVASWKKLLETNPDYPNRDQVSNLIAKAEQHANMKPGMKTDKPAQIR